LEKEDFEEEVGAVPEGDVIKETLYGRLIRHIG
jgi:hypothetical protein